MVVFYIEMLKQIIFEFNAILTYVFIQSILQMEVKGKEKTEKGIL